MADESFEIMLSGGHPNSLGRTVEVVDLVLADQNKLALLYQCYFSQDEVVRLRTSSAIKRVWRAQPDWLLPYLDRFLEEISQINQASTQWTLAEMLNELGSHLSNDHIARGKTVLKRNLEQSNDWIVLINTMQVLAVWAKHDPELKQWLAPYLDRLARDSRKSVARNAEKLKKTL